MREHLIGYPYASPIPEIAAIRYLATTVVIAGLSLGGWASETRGEALRWKLSAGEVLHYTLEGKEVQVIKVMGRDKKSTKTSTTNLSWTVKSVSTNGDAEIDLRFDRVRVRIEKPPFMPLEFDSAPNKLEIPEEFEATERQIKALAGAQFTFTLRPTGEVDDLKVPPQTLKNIRDATPQEAAGQGAVSEQSLKDMLLQSSPPTFPLDSVEPGKTWAGKPSKMPIPGLGSLKVDQVFSFQGPDSKSPNLLLVAVEARVTLEPAENVSAKIRAQEGKGSLTFDAAAGRIVNSRNNQKMEMIITDRGQDIVQSTETNSVMTLEP
jgi:hypothetical protein